MIRISRISKSRDMRVAGELLRYGLDVYLPCDDSDVVNLVVRVNGPDTTYHFDIVVRSVAAYGRIFGARPHELRNRNYILVIAYRHDDRDDELFYLTAEQVDALLLKDKPASQLMLSAEEREEFSRQSLPALAQYLLSHSAPPGATTIQRLALQHTVRHLGDAIQVATPVQDGEEWEVRLTAKGSNRVLGHLRLTKWGEIIESQSATYDSVREDTDAARPKVSAA